VLVSNPNAALVADPCNEAALSAVSPVQVAEFNMSCGGVDFRFAPRTTKDKNGPFAIEPITSSETVVNLNPFTGVLCLMPKSSENKKDSIATLNLSSFGGVNVGFKSSDELRLPWSIQTTPASNVTLESMDPKLIVLNLTSFRGTLRVTLTQSEGLAKVSTDKASAENIHHLGRGARKSVHQMSQRSGLTVASAGTHCKSKRKRTVTACDANLTGLDVVVADDAGRDEQKAQEGAATKAKTDVDQELAVFVNEGVHDVPNLHSPEVTDRWTSTEAGICHLVQVMEEFIRVTLLISVKHESSFLAKILSDSTKACSKLRGRAYRSILDMQASMLSTFSHIKNDPSKQKDVSF
jgi:hypothetical protein